MRAAIIRTALASAIGAILFDADSECRKLLLHICGAAVAAEMFGSAAGRFEELSYFATLGTFVFKYGHHLLPLLKEAYDMMNTLNNQQQIGNAFDYSACHVAGNRKPEPGGQG